MRLWKKFVSSVASLAVFAPLAFADAGAVKFKRVSDDYVCSSTGSGSCYFDLSTGQVNTALITVGAQGAQFVLSADAVAAGTTFTVWQKVDPNLATSATGMVFFACSALTNNYCNVTPGSYWVELTSPTVGTLRVTEIK